MNIFNIEALKFNAQNPHKTLPSWDSHLWTPVIEIIDQQSKREKFYISFLAFRWNGKFSFPFLTYNKLL